MADARGELASTLLVSDLDGTLLRPDASLGPRSISVINGLIARGGVFTYATARSFTSASRATAGLALAAPVATYGGAMRVDPRTGRTLGSHLMPAAAARAVLEETARRGAPQPIVFAEHRGRDRVCWLPGRTTPFVQAFLDARPGDPRLLPLGDWSQLDPASVLYVSLIGEEAGIRRLAAALGPALDQCHAVLGRDMYDGAHWLELSAAGATKASAVQAIAAQVGARRIVCFGDGLNDLPMLAAADHAVAVAGADPQVIAAASEVIGDHADDAVAEWIAAWLEGLG